jgi:predicted DNA binding CopG/RHH family protein
MRDTGAKENISMKAKTVEYTNDLGAMKGFEGSRVLTRTQEQALGIPAPGAATRLLRKAKKPARINIRMAEETLDGLKLRAAEAGLPYQTLAASVLHMVATGKLRLDLVKA